MTLQKEKKQSFALIMSVYLLGIFMGALDTGIVTPARTVIQNGLSVSDTSSVWIITIYTLAYAASIPVMGKFADRVGRKYIYLLSIFLFAIGSLFCGLAQSFESFQMLLAARAVQAIGGGGIIPVATAEFGTTFPEEKKGMALGLVGGVFGMANVFGASAGSLILDIFGSGNWQFIFYINIPISIFILIAGVISLPNTTEKEVKAIDGLGITILTVMVLSLMYGLKNIDFFKFMSSMKDIDVYPYLITFIVLLPIFIFIERRAEDPVLNLSYFKQVNIVITLILAMITGIILMGMIFVPQLAENSMKMRAGSGGYFVIILGVFAGIGAPVSGKLIDKYGVKMVLGFGLLASLVGALFLIFVTTEHPTLVNVIISLIFIGVGMGFTMGTPLNYMMLEQTRPEESNSALATVSLIRSIGTAVAPTIMVGFIAHAGMGVQSDIMEVLPKEIKVPELPYAEELTNEFNKLKTDEKTKKQFENMEIPDMTSFNTVKIDMQAKGDYKIPNDIIKQMQSSDVTNIVANTKNFTSTMFDQMTPKIINKIEKGLDSGISGMEKTSLDMESSLEKMQKAYDGMDKGIKGMENGISSQDKAINKMREVKNQIPKEYLKELKEIKSMDDLNSKINELENAKSALTEKINEMQNAKENGAQGLDEPIAKMEQAVSGQNNAINQLTKIKNQMGNRSADNMFDLDGNIKKLEKAKSQLTMKLNDTQKNQEEMKNGMDSLKSAKNDIEASQKKMVILKKAVPKSFETAQKNYIKEINKKSTIIEGVFQKALNVGFKQVYETVAIASSIGLILLVFYKDSRKLKQM